MRARKIVTNVNVSDIDTAKAFYRDYLGLEHEEFDLGWVARFTAPDGGPSVQLVSGDKTSPADSSISVMTDDIDSAYAEAQEHGFEIVHPLTTEEWGVRRFLVRAPDGTVVNIVRHH